MVKSASFRRILLLLAAFTLLVGLTWLTALLCAAPVHAASNTRAESPHQVASTRATDSTAAVLQSGEGAAVKCTIRGTVREIGKGPLSGMRVTAEPGNLSCETDVQGVYVLAVEPGSYVLSVAQACYLNPLTQAITVSASEPERTADFSFAKRYNVRGSVSEEGGSGIPDVWVSVYPLDCITTTDSTGAYTVSVPAGTYQLSVHKDGWTSPPPRSLRVEHDENYVNFVFSHRYLIQGTVRNYDNTPVSEAWVSVDPGGMGTWTNTRGAYTLTVISGAYTVSVTKAGYPVPPTIQVSVPPDQREQDFRFPERFAISGTVRDHDQTPLQNVLVTLLPDGYSTYTDHSGIYSFSVVSGTYSINASKTGWPAPASKTVSVPPPASGLDFEFPARHSIGGSVLDATNHAVSGVWVAATPNGSTEQTDVGFALVRNTQVGEYTGQTDANGIYTLTVMAGDYDVHISSTGLPPTPSQRVSTPPDHFDVRFSLPPTYTICGTVRHADGQPAADAWITTSPGGYNAFATTQGAYTLTLPEGTYSLSISKPGYPSPATQSVTVPPSQAGIDFTFPQIYTITGTVRDAFAHVVEGAMLTASPGGYTTWSDSNGVYTLTLIAGTYSLSVSKGGYPNPAARSVTVPPSQSGIDWTFPQTYVIGGSVRDSDGSSMPGVLVSYLGSMSGSTYTDGTGSYSFTVLAGTYDISVYWEGRTSPPSQAVTVPPDRTNVNFTFAAPSVISGTILDWDGSPLADALVLVNPGYSTRSAANGTYSVTVRDGTYTLNVSKNDYPPPATQVVSVPPSRSNVDFRFPQRYTISGRVLEADGTPVADVSVGCIGPSSVSTISNARGVYTLTVLAGTYSVSARKSGYPSLSEQNVSVPPSRADINFTFPARYTVAGTVRDWDGTPVSDALVSASPSGDSTWSNASGGYSLLLTAGTYTIHVSKYGLPDLAPQMVSVPPSRSDVNFSFPQRYTIAGMVRDYDGSPVGQVWVSSSPGGVGAYTGDNGAYAFSVAAGTYSVSANKSGYSTLPAQSISVPPSRSDVNFTFAQRYTIAGTVRDPAGNLVSDAFVTANPGGYSTFTNAQGAFSLSVPAGTYSVSASKSGYPSALPQNVTVPPSRSDVALVFTLINIGGTVRDASGSPVLNATVTATPGGGSTLSDANGMYTLTVQAGTYSVSVFKSGYPTPSAQTVSVPPSRFDVNFSFPATYTICGWVREHDGNPVSNVSVSALSGNYTTFTDANGYYCLTMVAGSYEVSVYRSGFANLPAQSVTVPPSRSDVNFTYAQRFVISGTVRNYDGTPVSDVAVLYVGPQSGNATTNASGAYSFSVIAGSYEVSVSKTGYRSPDPQSVTVPPSHSDVDFSFRQVFSIAGMVLDYDQTPVSGVTVSASPGGFVTSTDANGHFSLDVIAGTYSVSAAKVGHLSPPAQSITVPPNRDNITFVFLQPYTIAGHTRDADGAPLAGVQITAIPDGGFATTDASGAYTLQVGAGTYSVSASKLGLASPPAQSITVPPSRSDVDFSFPRLYVIGGVVRDAAGTPVSEAWVSATPAGVSASTDASGVYTLTVVAGTYSVSIVKYGYASPPAQTVSVPPSRTDVHFAFLQLYTIAGIVRDYDGSPLVNVTVSAYPGGYAALSDANGTYTLYVAQGSYVVSTLKEGYPSPAPQTVVVPPSHNDVNFTFSQTFTISGTVRNYDSSPLPGVLVTASPGGDSTLTDENGAYRIVVIAGTYSVAASKYGYPTLPVQSVTVPPNHNDVNFTFSQTFTISGTVRDYDGTPVPAALVSASPGGHVTSTDATGAYTLTVVGGTYLVGAAKGGYLAPPAQSVSVPPSRSDVFFTFLQRCAIGGTVRDSDGRPVAGATVSASPGGYSAVSDANGAYLLTVAAGTYNISVSKLGYPSPAAISITVPPSRSDVDLTFLQTYDVSGTVRDASGAVLADVLVSATPGAVSATTDAHGVYTLTLLAGTYSVSVYKYGYASPPAQTVTVPPSHSNVDFSFSQIYTIRGHVRDYDGTPILGALVSASPGGYGADTDITGAYTLSVTAGTYSLSVTKYGLPSPANQSINVPPDATSIDFTFPQRYTISGSVRDAVGNPVAGTLVSTSPDNYSTLSNASGVYTLSVLPGTYAVSVSKEGYSSPAAQSATVPPNREHVDFTFLLGYTIRGHVHEFDGTPVAEALVSASPGGYVASTDASGVYTLSVAGGTYQVSAAKAGYPSISAQSVSVPPNRTGVDFAFPQRCSIAGVVRDASGNPAQDALITASPGGYNAMTDDAGAYSLSVVAGTYSVSAAKTGYASPAAQTVTVPPNRTDVNFAFLHTYTIAGLVREADGTAVADAQITTSPSNYRTQTDATGAYTLAVTAGTYSVSVAKADYPTLPAQSVTVPPEHNDVNFTFPQRYTIRGTVRSQSNTPVQDVLVTLSPVGLSVFTDASGVYTFSVAAGTYSVSIAKQGYPSPSSQPVSVPPSQYNVDVQFLPTYTIAGTVRDYDDTPVSGVQVSVAPGGYVTTTDANGMYAVSVVSGTYNVTVSKVGYPTLPMRAISVPPERTDVDFVFPRRYAVRGYVRNWDGSPVADATVAAAPGLYTAQTDASGAYTLTLEAGVYTITVNKVGYPELPEKSVSVPPERNDIDFTYAQRYTLFLPAVFK